MLLSGSLQNSRAISPEAVQVAPVPSGRGRTCGGSGCTSGTRLRIHGWCRSPWATYPAGYTIPHRVTPDTSDRAHCRRYWHGPNPEVTWSPGELLRSGQEQEEVGRAGWRDGRHSQASRREADSVSPWRSVVGVVARSRRTTIGGRRETAIPWDPGEYLRFGDERTRPAVDLASRIAVESPRAVIDLGRGPGNSTQVLRRRCPAPASADWTALRR